MTKWELARWTALMSVVPVVVLAASTVPAEGGLDGLVGYGADGFLWGCGVCAGSALIIAAKGMTSVIGFLVSPSSLAKITGCLGVCYAAFS
ncbi:MAG: hypothetical protein AMXMBFR53_37220 [Gemmatimonadota bacterium]